MICRCVEFVPRPRDGIQRFSASTLDNGKVTQFLILINDVSCVDCFHRPTVPLKSKMSEPKEAEKQSLPSNSAKVAAAAAPSNSAQPSAQAAAAKPTAAATDAAEDFVIVTVPEFTKAVRWLRGNIHLFSVHKMPRHIRMIYYKIPESLDWDNLAQVRSLYPPINTEWRRNNRQIPRCLLLECETPAQKLAIVHWWNMHSPKDQQALLANQIKRNYRTPTRSASPSAV